MDCSLPAFSVHGIFQARKYWSGLSFPSPGDFLNPRTELLHCRQILYYLSHQVARFQITEKMTNRAKRTTSGSASKMQKGVVGGGVRRFLRGLSSEPQTAPPALLLGCTRPVETTDVSSRMPESAELPHHWLQLALEAPEPTLSPLTSCPLSSICRCSPSMF